MQCSETILVILRYNKTSKRLVCDTYRYTPRVRDYKIFSFAGHPRLLNQFVTVISKLRTIFYLHAHRYGCEELVLLLLCCSPLVQLIPSDITNLSRSTLVYILFTLVFNNKKKNHCSGLCR